MTLLQWNTASLANLGQNVISVDFQTLFQHMFCLENDIDGVDCAGKPANESENYHKHLKYILFLQLVQLLKATTDCDWKKQAGHIKMSFSPSPF